VEGVFDPLADAAWQALRLLWPLWLALLALLIVRVGLLLYRQRRLARSGIAEIDRMSGPVFEQFLATLFRGLGYRVERTGRAGDFGADLIIAREGVRTIVQAKRYARSVGVKAVQEAFAAKNMYGCTAAMVVTNSRFTRQAQTLARANQVELWDRDALIERILTVRQRKGEERPVEDAVSQEG
jgi:restriction system protein